MIKNTEPFEYLGYSFQKNKVAIASKSKEKIINKNTNNFGCRFDKFMQNTNYNETNGIIFCKNLFVPSKTPLVLSGIAT